MSSIPSPADGGVQPANDDFPKRLRGVGTGGKFFVLDSRQWATIWTAVTDNRMNLALMYLLFLCGSGADQGLTKWSVSAAARYLSMRKEASRLAIITLVRIKLIAVVPGLAPNHPQYRIVAGKRSGEAIFLPNRLVTGHGDGDTPLLRTLRETGDPLMVRLLIALYSAVTTDAPHAVRLSLIRTVSCRAPTAKLVREVGAHAIWEVAMPDPLVTTGFDTRPYDAEADPIGFLGRLRMLEKLGAIYFEPWLCSSGAADADPIFPLGPVAPHADQAGRTLVEDTGAGQASRPGHLVTLPTHHTKPAIQDLMRMKIEADTPRRRDADSERKVIVAHWIAEYERVLGDARAGNFCDPVRTMPRRPQPRQASPSRRSRSST